MPSTRYRLPRFAAGCAATAIAAALNVLATAAAAEPITLAEALARAAATSPTLAAAEADVAAAEGRARQSGFRPNPELGVEVENFAGTGAFSGLRDAETTVSVGQRLELGGKRPARQRAAEAQVVAARLRLSVARADLLKDVRDAYAEAFADSRRVELAREQFLRAENLQTIATELVDAGREPPLRALRARTAAFEAVARVRAAEAEYGQAQRALAALWGGADDLPEPVAPMDEAVPAVVVDPAEALDVRLAEAEVASSVAVVARERTLSRPDVTVSVGARQFRGSDDTALVVGASLPIGIFDRNQGNIAAANAERMGAEARRNAALAQAIRRTRDAQAALRTAEARLIFLETRAEPEAIEAVRIAREGFSAGRFTLLDVLDAEEALNTVQSELITAQLDRGQAIAALTRATETEGSIQ
ncbi:MAG: TolC family protein [Alphaproteobacteria bacterium]|uniref:TolC family protein n=1 Tax=Brevundimonas sp. TaxID=1871086 RepID=UPI0017D44BE0|nr:TolC family protein [Brevundimonas sp.]MBU3971771.1 TolC family protein [Alphaproteobacteria bacterium]MBA3049910.1 TolC family protein [Brevundimonas sp.]MBU3974448.1 TolC family protein [Alphaproteobacteria bacterium]MBU4039564.1 TolC family protein [Alphaproteobacteria bacterium]MBU4137873.1 TolC family protein [Alphaproteobacteria bacterium]